MRLTCALVVVPPLVSMIDERHNHHDEPENEPGAQDGYLRSGGVSAERLTSSITPASDPLQSRLGTKAKRRPSTQGGHPWPDPRPNSKHQRRQPSKEKS